MIRARSRDTIGTCGIGPDGSIWRSLSAGSVAVSLMALLLACCWLIASPSPAVAAEIRQGDTVIVPPGEVIDDDLYAFGTTITIQGTVNGDVIATGQSVNVSGPVAGSVMAVGQSVEVSGRVGGSLMAAGQSVDISGPVGTTARLAGQSIDIRAPIADDLLAGGATLNVRPGATIGRDLLTGGNIIIVDGPVGRSIRAGGESLTLSGPVGGGVMAQVGTLHLRSGAAIAGAIDYTSGQEAVIDGGATVGGPISRTAPVIAEEPNPAAQLGERALAWLRGLIGIAILGLALVLVFPGFSRRATDGLVTSPWASLGLGFAILVGLPVLALLLFGVGLLVGGWWIGLIAVALYLSVLPVGYVVGGLCFGRLIMRQAGRPQMAMVWSLLAGLTLLALVSLVPYLGTLVTLVTLMFGLGALILGLSATYSGRADPGRPAAEPRSEVQGSPAQGAGEPLRVQ